MSDLDKLEFAKQVVELQTKVKEMEAEAEAKDRPLKDEVREVSKPLSSRSISHLCTYIGLLPQATEKFSHVETQWDSIATALDPFAMEPSLDPSVQYMVPRPETSELDGVIGRIEEQLGELQVCTYMILC